MDLWFFLRLRDKRVREIKYVADLFYHSDHEFQKSVAKEIQYHQGKSLLLLYEGYDELPKRQQTQQSIFLDILRKESLPHATILITSRQSATKSLHLEFRDQISQHIEILGFTADDIISYVQHVITDEKVYRDFLQYLKCYPYIRGMMYVPLNAVVVTEVYQSSLQSPEEFFPTTMTELYTALTRSLLLRYLHSKYGEQEWTLNNFSDLPKVLYEQFCHICMVALKGMIEGEFVFYDLPNDFNTLDLMQSVPELYVECGTVVSYNFFHLTLQEFLAAVKISKLPMKKQIAFLEGNVGTDGLAETDLILPDSGMELCSSDRKCFSVDPQVTMNTTPPENQQEPCLPVVMPHPQLLLLTAEPTPDYEMPGIAQFDKYTQSHSKDYEKDLETAVDIVKVMGISSTQTESDIGHSIIHLPQPQHQYGLSQLPSNSQSPPCLSSTSLDNLPPLSRSHHIASLGTKLIDTTSTRFQKVLRFVAGLTKYENIPLDSLQQLLFQQEREDVINISLNSLHWLFESQCISIYGILISNFSILRYHSHTTMTPFDCFVLGYALSHISCTGYWEIEMTYCRIEDECVQMLVSGIRFKYNQTFSVQ